MAKSYQVIIIGGGPAGLTAGLYTTRARLHTLLIEKLVPGGQITNAELVENYPGFPDGISGLELGELMQKQATKYGLELLAAEVQGIELAGENKIVKTSDGEYLARAVIICGGSDYAKLGVPGEERLTGKGVSYCAICDGAFFKDEVIAVLGGGDAALTEALFLTRFASKLIIIHRRHELRAAKILQERAFADSKIEFIWDTVVESLVGDDRLKELKLRDVKTGGQSSLEVSGVFVAIGQRPNTEYLSKLLTLAPGGFIPVNDRMETEIPGVFAAGDIRQNSARQAVAAAGDGATAALSAERFLSAKT